MPGTTLVQLNIALSLLFRYSIASTFGPNTGTIFRTSGLVVSLPNSPGMKRFTPAAIAASMIRAWSRKPPAPPRVQMTASWPARFWYSDSKLKSVLMTLTNAGKTALDPLRLRTVTLKGELRNWFSTAGPRFPEAWMKGFSVYGKCNLRGKIPTPTITTFWMSDILNSRILI